MKDRIALIREWAAVPKSSTWMARQLGVTRSRISQIAKEHGIPLTYHQSEVGIAEMLERFKPARELRRGQPLLKRRHPDYAKRLAAIQAAAAKGETYDQVAARLGVSRSIVAGMAYRNGIKFGAAA